MNDLLERLRQALADRYSIQRELGAGGMATVYLAEDLRHHRQVALKVLRPDLAASLGAERFVREITVAANLQHPHVLPLYDSGEVGGFLFYVMPFVDGLSLRQKLIREGELPVAEAARILRDIADALAYAHAKGVVHRDIKPENVMLSGRHALVTDFGVAKAVSEATGRHSLTTAGVALGTPTYMAPEQATADPMLDHRADLYAFGVLAYELLTGHPPFGTGTPQAILAAHVTTAPAPVTASRPSIPPALAALVMRCLEKKPADRFQSAEDVIPVLESVLTPSGGITPTATAPHRAARATGMRRVTAAGAAAGLAVIGFLAWSLSDRDPPPLVLGQTTQVTLDPGLELLPALSPDGRLVAFASGEMGSLRIFVKAVGSGTPVQVTREPSGNHGGPRWSPDGSQLLYFASGGLYVVPALGGPSRILVPSKPGAGVAYGDWSPDGSEVVYVEGTLAVRDSARILRRRVDGGSPRLVAQDIEVHTPRWSPDGRAVAYVSGNFQYNYGANILGNLGPSQVFVVPADGGTPVAMTDKLFLHASPAWMPDSRSLLVVSTRGGGRDVFRLRIGRRGAAGEPDRLTTGLSAGSIDVSDDGTTLAYTRFTNDANAWSAALPATGVASVRAAQPVTRGSQHVEGLSVSPEGAWLTFDSDRGGNADIWKVPLDGGEATQLTTDPRDDFIPNWSPDGRWIAFHSWRHGNRDVYVIQADGQGEERVTDDPSHDMYPTWAPDSRSLVFYSNRSSPNDLYVSTRDERGWSAPRRITQGGATAAHWSPDGRMIAFLTRGGVGLVSPSGGDERVLAQPIRLGGSPFLAQHLLWTPDGRALFVKGRLGSERDGSVLLVPLDGGAARELLRFDDPTRPSGRQEFSYHGGRLYFTVEDRRSDVFVGSIERR